MPWSALCHPLGEMFHPMKICWALTRRYTSKNGIRQIFSEWPAHFFAMITGVMVPVSKYKQYYTSHRYIHLCCSSQVFFCAYSRTIRPFWKWCHDRKRRWWVGSSFSKFAKAFIFTLNVKMEAEHRCHSFFKNISCDFVGSIFPSWFAKLKSRRIRRSAESPCTHSATIDF